MTVATQEQQVVLKAIDELGRRVTAADVATKTGLPILKVTQDLNQIAAETQGHMEVAESGDLAYRFAPGFQAAYAAKGMRKAFEEIWAVVFKVGYFVMRISFGVMLILSLLAIVLLIWVLITYYSRGGNNDRDRGGDFGFNFSFFDYLIMRDLMYWLIYGSYDTAGQRPYRYDQPTHITPNKSNFFFNVFSFLFGDGNPNLNLHDRKWAMIAEVIRRNGGVVTAEQLAPYTGQPPTFEDGVLPVLVRFNGKPEVTESGDIIYTFPDMQVTAHEMRIPELPTHLKEFPWKFTNVPAGDMLMVYILAGVNFVGSWFLFFHMIASRDILMAFFPLILMLVMYGTMFVAVPAVRALVLSLMNGRIEKRNADRESYARQLENPPAPTLKKLADAKTMKLGLKLLNPNQAIFTTEKDSLEQEFDASP